MVRRQRENGRGVAVRSGARASPWPAVGPPGPADVMAATFFGEVVKAPCRTGAEDEEEEEEEARRETPEDRVLRQQLAQKR